MWGVLLVAACAAEQGTLTGPSGSGTTETPDAGNEPASVTLAWDAPSVSEDGTPLTDLAGYMLYYGTASPVTVANGTAVDVGAASRHTLTGLAPGTYYVAVSAYDTVANEGPLSAEVSVQVQP